VTIDIGTKSGRLANSIESDYDADDHDCDDGSGLEAAILTTPDFDARTVDAMIGAVAHPDCIATCFHPEVRCARRVI
jgi:hypothetical protein